MSDQAAEPPALVAQTTLTGLDMEVGTLAHPTSGETIRVLKLQIQVELVIPFTPDAARDFAQSMSGGIVISKEMPNANGN